MIKRFCDRCGKEAEKLRAVKISVGTPSIYTTNYEDVSVEICDECQAETGVIDFIKKHSYEKKPVEQSVQEKFFELFNDLVAESIENTQ